MSCDCLCLQDGPEGNWWLIAAPTKQAGLRALEVLRREPRYRPPSRAAILVSGVAEPAYVHSGDLPPGPPSPEAFRPLIVQAYLAGPAELRRVGRSSSGRILQSRLPPVPGGGWVLLARMADGLPPAPRTSLEVLMMVASGAALAACALLPLPP